MRRLALLVLDAADRSFVLDLAARGELPHLARLLADGTLAPLQTPVTYRSEYANTELLTAAAAVDNRYWSTVYFDPTSYACVSVGSARRRPFWEPAGGRVVTFDVPHAILSDDLPGTQVVGWGGHDARFQHPRMSSPAGLIDEIDVRFGPDPLDAVEYQGSWHQPPYIEALADAAVESARVRTDIARWLLDREPDWSLFVMGMREPHSAGHVLAHGLDPEHVLASHPTAAAARARFVDVYRAIDEVVGAIAAALPPDAVLGVVSPKGMSPVRDDVASGLLLAELLLRLSGHPPFIHEPTHRSWRRRGCPPIAPDPARRSGDRAVRLMAEGRLAPLKRRYHLLVPDAVRRSVNVVRRRGLEAAPPPAPVQLPDGSSPLLQSTLNWHPSMWYRRFWPTLPWFALPTFSDGHVRMNVRGRERDGVIDPADYDRACDELETALRQAVDPRTGEPAVDEVFRMRADDPMTPDGPSADLVVTWRGALDALEHPTAGTIGPFAFPRGGTHNADGFLIAAGAGVAHSTTETHAVLDVGPTVRTLLGWEPKPDLPGSVIPELSPRPVARPR